MNINERVAKLRATMIAKGLDAYIIPSTDPHISEYVAERWKAKTWISGFTGSVAKFVVTKNHSGLWVDSRYWLQSEEELKGTEIEVFKLGKDDVPDFTNWIVNNLSAGNTVGYDGMCVPYGLDKQWRLLFNYWSIKVNSDYDLLDEIWEDRPAIPREKIFAQPIKYAGVSREDKLANVRNQMAKKGVDTHIIASLDDICWLFNIRGRDVAYNPVAYCYSIITKDKAELYIYNDKVESGLSEELHKSGIVIRNYDDIYSSVKNISANAKVYIDPARINAGLSSMIPSNCQIVEGMNFTTMMKAVKNNIELDGMRAAMQRDCIAMVKFQYWLENNLGKVEISELTTMDVLRGIRAESDMFFGESFGTIAGYKGNGAIVHYSSSTKTNVELHKDGFFLLDSGGQYYDGTTDITRMYYLGSQPTEEEMIDYTLVLKGHIDLNLAIFPTHTRGSQLDILARHGLWQRLQNYGHGTGHGVGCFMNVHEGPQNIRMDENPVTLVPGMIISNEPGMYRAGKFGIRIENLVNVIEAGASEFGKFYTFEVLTLCPIDKKPIKKDLLNDDEINWLNEYHQRVYNSVKDDLSQELRDWLADKTSPL